MIPQNIVKGLDGLARCEGVSLVVSRAGNTLPTKTSSQTRVLIEPCRWDSPPSWRQINLLFSPQKQFHH